MTLSCVCVCACVSPQYGWTPLHQAAYSCHYKMVDSLIAAGANVNAISDNGV